LEKPRGNAAARVHRLDALLSSRQQFQAVKETVNKPELDMDWIQPWIGLDWIGSEVFFDKFVM